jgi:glycosyltransferase involved in cell wall biosynthesis
VLADDELRRNLSERGRHRVETKFAWPIVAREHLDFFETLLASRSGS